MRKTKTNLADTYEIVPTTELQELRAVHKVLATKAVTEVADPFPTRTGYILGAIFAVKGLVLFVIALFSNSRQ